MEVDCVVLMVLEGDQVGTMATGRRIVKQPSDIE